MATRPTIHDVAKAAGVSVTTVSHALNDKGRVDPATRARVAQVVSRLGYRANRHARGLRSGRSGTLALLLPVESDGQSDEALSLDFYMRLASAAAAAAFSQEQALILLPPTAGEASLRALPVDGGIVVDPSPHDPRLDLLDRVGLPAVSVERDHGRPDDIWYVASETDANTRRMLDHLSERGARRIALLLPQADWAWAAETLTAYQAWTRERGAEQIIVPVAMRSGEESALAAARRLLSGGDPPDAIFAAAARFIRGALRAAHACGSQVPRDLLLAAGVDSIHAREGDPPVTALDLHPERQGAAAVEMLLARLDGTRVDAPRHITATLQVRASTVGSGVGAGPDPRSTRTS